MTEPSNPEVHVWLRATSEIVTPEQIEAQTGLKPDRVRHAGRITKPSKVPSKFHRWQIDSGVDKSRPIEEHFAALLARVAGHEDRIAALKADAVDVHIGCAIYSDSYNVSESLPPAVMNAITRMNADFWFDIYTFSQTETRLIRPERATDRAAIHTIHASAFETDAEARLVDALRANGNLTISLVAEVENEIVGHVAFSPVTLDGHDVRALGLAPVAVLPEHQNEGIGAALIRAGIAECERQSYNFIVLLGHPHYYPRFGFTKASKQNLQNEYNADEAFMAYEIKEGAIPAKGGLVQYGPEFRDL